MTMIPITTKNQATKNPSGKEADNKERQTSDDRHEVGLIAAIMVVLALGILGYWIVEEGENQATGTTSAAVTEASENWERNKGKKGESPEGALASSLVLPVSADRGEGASDVQSPILTQVDMDVYFGFNQHSLTDETKSLVQEELARRGERSDWTLSIEGHADQLGPEPYNQALGLQRAESIKQFLLGLGVPEQAIRVTSMGETAPVCHETDEECYHKNRRAHVLWSKGKLVTQTSSSPIESSQPELNDSIKLATVSTGERDSEMGQPSPLESEDAP